MTAALPPATLPPQEKEEEVTFTIVSVKKEADPTYVDDSLYVENNVLYRKLNFGEFNAYAPTASVPVQVKVEWCGSKMSYDLWVEIMSFLDYTFVKHKSEGIVRLYYNFDTAVWAAHAHPQPMITSYGNTMTIQDKISNEQKASMLGEFIQMGSIHHHCSAGAFQSGDDANGELPIRGIHATIGNMDKERTVHSRYSYNKMFLKADILDFIEEPVWLREFIEKMGLDEPTAQTLRRKALLQVKVNHDLIPKVWLENLEIRKSTPSYTYNVGDVWDPILRRYVPKQKVIEESKEVNPRKSPYPEISDDEHAALFGDYGAFGAPDAWRKNGTLYVPPNDEPVNGKKQKKKKPKKNGETESITSAPVDDTEVYPTWLDLARTNWSSDAPNTLIHLPNAIRRVPVVFLPTSYDLYTSIQDVSDALWYEQTDTKEAFAKFVALINRCIAESATRSATESIANAEKATDFETRGMYADILKLIWMACHLPELGYQPLEVSKYGVEIAEDAIGIVEMMQIT